MTHITLPRAVVEQALATLKAAEQMATYAELKAALEASKEVDDEIAFLLREMWRVQKLMLHEIGIGFHDPRIFAKYGMIENELQDTHGTCGSKTSVPAEVLHTGQAESPLINVPNSHHPAPAVPEIKGHQIAQLVNQLRDIAIKYHDHQSLRERLAGPVHELWRAAAPKPD